MQQKLAIVAGDRRTGMYRFEAMLSVVLAIAAQALAIGAVVTL